MMRALSIAATGMQAQQLNVETISNNLANINTTAFKRQRVEFQDLLYQNERRMGASSSDADTIIPTGIQIGLGVAPGAIYRIHDQGEFIQTSNDFDLALGGKGYFVVDLPDGTQGYTRASSFQLNQNGEVVTSDGYTVSPGITVPLGTTDITINANGEVFALVFGDDEPTNIGQFDVASFINDAGLSAQGGNLYYETAASGAPTIGVGGIDGNGEVLQGYLETSNVDPVKEITQLITAQRGYELSSKVIQAGDEMMQTANQAKR